MSSKDAAKDAKAFLAALKKGKADLMTPFLEKGGSERANSQDKHGRPVIFMAVEIKRADCVSLLLKHGAVVAVTEKKAHSTPLHIAATQGTPDIVKLLIDAQGCDLNAQDKAGDTALHQACGRGFVDIVRLLVEKGADLTITNAKYQPPAQLAAKKNKREVLTLLDELKKQKQLQAHSATSTSTQEPGAASSSSALAPSTTPTPDPAAAGGAPPPPPGGPPAPPAGGPPPPADGPPPPPPPGGPPPPAGGGGGGLAEALAAAKLKKAAAGGGAAGGERPAKAGGGGGMSLMQEMALAGKRKPTNKAQFDEHGNLIKKEACGFTKVEMQAFVQDMLTEVRGLVKAHFTEEILAALGSPAAAPAEAAAE